MHTVFSPRHARFLFSSSNKACFHNFPLVRTAKELRNEDIRALFEGKILALQISNYCTYTVTEHALNRLSSRAVKDYSNAPGVGRFDIGMSYFETVESPEQMAAYYESAVPAMEKIRKVFSPFIAPMDKARITLDEQWPNGCKLLNLNQGPMFVGLMRALTEQVLPHEDKLERDDAEAQRKLKHRIGETWSQFAINCYLQVPKMGGELKLWNISLSDEDYKKLQETSCSSYGILPKYLPKAIVEIHPNNGDLIIFNARNLHAVNPSMDNPKTLRISSSGFILYRGSDHELNMWS